jgi:hypothetical protein
MEATSDGLSTDKRQILSQIRVFFSQVPLLSWLLGLLVAVALEYFIGTSFARALGLRKAPMLFGFVIMLKKPALIHSALIYLFLIYLLPITVIARLSAAGMNRLAAKFLDYPLMLSALIHLGLLYLILHWWSDMSLYRAEVLRYTLIAVLLTLSLNLINGYMGEFSCSHPGFMALGAYGSSVFTVGLFADDKLFGAAAALARSFLFPPRPNLWWTGGGHRRPGGGHTLVQDTGRLPGYYFTGLYVYREKPDRESGVCGRAPWLGQPARLCQSAGGLCHRGARHLDHE